MVESEGYALTPMISSPRRVDRVDLPLVIGIDEAVDDRVADFAGVLDARRRDGSRIEEPVDYTRCSAVRLVE